LSPDSENQSVPTLTREGDVFLLDLGSGENRFNAVFGNTPELLTAALVVGARVPFAPYLNGWSPWNFAGPAVTAQRLRAAGFTDIHTGLV
jgi:hypothetical protein